MGESLLLEIGNLAQRLRELGIAADNDALIDDNQMAALDEEAQIIGDTVDELFDKTKFNDEVVDSALGVVVRKLLLLVPTWLLTLQTLVQKLQLLQ